MKLQSKIILIIITLMVILLNVYLYKTRDKSHDNLMFLNDNYNEIYLMKESLAISGFKNLSRDKLIVELNGIKSNTWKVVVNNKSYENRGKYPIISLIPGVHSYSIYSGNSNVLSLTLQYVPAEQYKEADFTWKDVYVVHDTSRPICKNVKYSIKDFATDEMFNKQEAERASSMLDSVVKIQKSDSTEQKVIKISHFILDNLDQFRGTPSDAVNQMSPLQQFEFAKSGNLIKPQGFWCSNFAEIYCFFANIAGVPTRRVDTYGEVDDVKLSGHAFTESYFQETQQWVYVDLNNRKLFIKNGEGDYLNASDVQKAISVGAYGGLVATIYKAGEILSVPYEKEAYWEKPYLSKRALLRYYSSNRTGERTWSYYLNYLFNPDYSVRHYIKLFALFGLLVCVVFWCYLIIAFRFNSGLK